MPTHKALRSVAHNLGTSFLSMTNYLENTFVVQHLLMAARDAHVSSLTIDLLAGTIHPERARSKAIARALGYVREQLRDMVVRSNSDMSYIASARMEITFRFAQKIPGTPPGHSFGAGVIVPEMVPYSCVVTIVDERGVSHKATIPEWWKQCGPRP